MLGFVKKDLLMVKGNLKTVLIILVVFILMALNGNGEFSFIPAFISVMVMMSTFSYDEYNKSDAYLTTLPGGRRSAVRAKYLATLLVVVFSVLVTFSISFVIGVMRNQLEMDSILSTTFGCGCGVLMAQAILYPIIYKFGIEKGRIGMFVVVFGITGILSLFVRSGVDISIPSRLVQFFDQYWMAILPMIFILVLGISYKVSEYFYVRKEY